MDNIRKRHFAKSLTWRIVGTLDTIVIAWIITGNPGTGVRVGLAEIITKIVLYYLHERVWFSLDLRKTGLIKYSRIRHLIKSVTWRIVGSLDTVLLAWWISGNPLAGLKIGGIEFISKMILYYLHERVWYKSSFGVDKVKE